MEMSSELVVLEMDLEKVSELGFLEEFDELKESLSVNDLVHDKFAKETHFPLLRK